VTTATEISEKLHARADEHFAGLQDQTSVVVDGRWEALVTRVEEQLSSTTHVSKLIDEKVDNLAAALGMADAVGGEEGGDPTGRRAAEREAAAAVAAVAARVAVLEEEVPAAAEEAARAAEEAAFAALEGAAGDGDALAALEARIAAFELRVRELDQTRDQVDELGAAGDAAAARQAAQAEAAFCLQRVAGHADCARVLRELDPAGTGALEPAALKRGLAMLGEHPSEACVVAVVRSAERDGWWDYGHLGGGGGGSVVAAAAGEEARARAAEARLEQQLEELAGIQGSDEESLREELEVLHAGQKALQEGLSPSCATEVEALVAESAAAGRDVLAMALKSIKADISNMDQNISNITQLESNAEQFVNHRVAELREELEERASDQVLGVERAKTQLENLQISTSAFQVKTERTLAKLLERPAAEATPRRVANPDDAGRRMANVVQLSASSELDKALASLAAGPERTSSSARRGLGTALAVGRLAVVARQHGEEDGGGDVPAPAYPVSPRVHAMHTSLFGDGEDAA
jgi:hypothetical protein